MGYKIAEYPVKLNGKLYRVGDKIPTLDATPINEKDVKVEVEKSIDEHKYSRSEIQLMKVEDLRNLATSVGIDATEKSGNSLKKALLEHFGL